MQRNGMRRDDNEKSPTAINYGAFETLCNFTKHHIGGLCGDRTHDKRIKSPLLYQLS